MAGNDIQVSVDPRQIARLEKALEELQKYTGRDCFQAVMYASVKVARSAAAAAKPGQRKREMRPDPIAPKSFIIVVRHQDKPPEFIKTWDRNDPRARVPRHGLSLNIFKKLEGMAASTKGQTFQRGSGDTRWAQFKLFSNQDVTVSNLTNFTTFIRDAYPQLETRAVEMGVNALNYKINEALGITIDRANRP